MKIYGEKMKKGTVYWFTGLSGAGKTTIGRIFFERLRGQKENAVFLDGDTLREVFGNDLGYGKDDRFKCAMRYSRLCHLLAGQGQDVAICTISMFHEVRRWNRHNIEKYKEIYIEVPASVLVQRNQKNLYSSGGNVVGMDLEPELPDSSDIIVDNDGSITPEQAAAFIWERLGIEGDGNG